MIFSLTGVGVFELSALVLCLQCFDTVGWAAGKTERWGAGMVICLERGADLPRTIESVCVFCLPLLRNVQDSGEFHSVRAGSLSPADSVSNSTSLPRSPHVTRNRQPVCYQPGHTHPCFQFCVYLMVSILFIYVEKKDFLS